jgi:hypothetical protein
MVPSGTLEAFSLSRISKGCFLVHQTRDENHRSGIQQFQWMHGLLSTGAVQLRCTGQTPSYLARQALIRRLVYSDIMKSSGSLFPMAYIHSCDNRTL